MGRLMTALLIALFLFGTAVANPIVFAPSVPLSEPTSYVRLYPGIYTAESWTHLGQLPVFWAYEVVCPAAPNEDAISNSNRRKMQRGKEPTPIRAHATGTAMFFDL